MYDGRTWLDGVLLELRVSSLKDVTFLLLAFSVCADCKMMLVSFTTHIRNKSDSTISALRKYFSSNTFLAGCDESQSFSADPVRGGTIVSFTWSAKKVSKFGSVTRRTLLAVVTRRHFSLCSHTSSSSPFSEVTSVVRVRSQLINLHTPYSIWYAPVP